MTSVWPTSSNAPDPAFSALACSWMPDPSEKLLGFIWEAYDEMASNRPVIETKDLERSITQLLEQRVDDAMSGDEPFYVQHGSFEHETMAAPPAQPPAYDLAFVLRADERVMWPIEAKVLETPGRLADYAKDVNDEFLTCRYAPFSGSGAMLGYLLSGSTETALAGIEKKLGCTLQSVNGYTARPHRKSTHTRTVPAGKSYPINFDCHHLILEYLGLKRSSS